MRKPKTWCVNFDSDEDVLRFGLRSNLWLMQYQYSHNGYTYQDNPGQTASITKNWRKLGRINVGDFFVAYVPHNRFFAIGRVRTPRKAWTQKDTIEHVTQDHEHKDEGIVWYTDVFYEDFTDDFARQVVNHHSKKPEVWKYNQRIDVETWRYFVEGGVEVKGMGQLNPRPDYRSAVFEIPKSFFHQIKNALEKRKLSQLPGAATLDGTFTQQLKQSASKIQQENYFDPQSLDDERERKLREIVQRRGQPDFRAKLISAYEGRCAVTGCDFVPALEAAHITPYLGEESNHISNGLLLRADIHTLLDLNLIGIDPKSLQVVIAEQLRGSYYEEMDGRELTLPEDAAQAPSKKALHQRWEEFTPT